jgi:hypothetical protein
MEVQPEGCGSQENSVIIAGATERAMTLNVIAGGFGVGLFSLPWSTAGASVLPAVAVVIFVIVLNTWTIGILVEAAERHQAFDMGSLLAKLPGKLGHYSQIIVNVAVYVTLFLVLVSYVDVMSQAVASLIDESSWWHNRQIWVLFACLLMAPVCFLDMRYLSFTSTLSVLVNLYIFGVLAFMSPKQSADVCWLGLSPGTIAMFSAMCQAVIIQMCVVPMYQELEDRSLPKFNRIIRNAFASLCIIFIAFSVVGVVSLGPGVSSNVLQNLVGFPAGNAAYAGAAVSVAAVFPIMERTMVAPIQNATGLRNKQTIYTLATIINVVVAGLVALVMPDVGYLNVLNGAFSCGVFVALVPATVGWYLLDRNKVALAGLLVFGLVMSILGLIFTDNYVSQTTKTCAWSPGQHSLTEDVFSEAMVFTAGIVA